MSTSIPAGNLKCRERERQTLAGEVRLEAALILRLIDSLRFVEMLCIRRSQSSISHQGEGTKKRLMTRLLRRASSQISDSTKSMTRSDSPARSDADTNYTGLRPHTRFASLYERDRRERSEAAPLFSLRVIARHEAIQMTSLPSNKTSHWCWPCLCESLQLWHKIVTNLLHTETKIM